MFKNNGYGDVIRLFVGELIVSAITVGVYALIGKFYMGVLFGALLGSVIITLNYFILAFSVNRAVDKALAERGDGEMGDEELERFTREHAPMVQASAKGSYLFRTLLLLGSLVLAFLLDGVFDVVATLVPLLLFRPVLMINEMLKGRGK